MFPTDQQTSCTCICPVTFAVHANVKYLQKYLSSFTAHEMITQPLALRDSVLNLFSVWLLEKAWPRLSALYSSLRL